jgi:hypothetical protein
MKSVRLCVAACVIAGLLIAGCNPSTTEEPKPAEEKEAVKAPETAKPAAPVAPVPAPKVAEAPTPVAAPATAEAPKPAQPAVAPQPPAGKFVLRVNCAATEPFTDKAGHVWVADQEWSEGKAWGAVDGMTVDRTDVGVKGTDNPKIYEMERYSMEAYKFTVPNGTYTVRLHFCETYEGITAADERVFGVSINGKPVLTDLDLFKEAGALKAVVKEFKDIQVTNGQLVIGFTPKVENPEINGIEILAQ